MSTLRSSPVSVVSADADLLIGRGALHERDPGTKIGHDRRMRIALMIVGLLVTALVVAGIMIRRLDHDAAIWHVDPLVAAKPSTPNSYRVGPDGTTEPDALAPTFSLSSAELAAQFDAIARGAGSGVVGGSAAEGHVTYVQTSGLFGFPDYVSVKFMEIDATNSTLAIFSRSRLGQSDLGVNKKRVEAWLGQLSS
jgi:uncharacterized protein (DUF1499 family)